MEWEWAYFQLNIERRKAIPPFLLSKESEVEMKSGNKNLGFKKVQ